jgi:hypothetical protein
LIGLAHEMGWATLLYWAFNFQLENLCSTKPAPKTFYNN